MLNLAKLPPLQYSSRVCRIEQKNIELRPYRRIVQLNLCSVVKRENAVQSINVYDIESNVSHFIAVNQRVERGIEKHKGQEIQLNHI